MKSKKFLHSSSSYIHFSCCYYLMIIWFFFTFYCCCCLADNQNDTKPSSNTSNSSIIVKKSDIIRKKSSSSSSSLSSSTTAASILTTTTSTTSKPTPLRQRFEFNSNFKPFRIDEINENGLNNNDNSDITHILMPHSLRNHPQFRRMPTTFRPSSSVLYLHPPKPKHIESIESVLTTLNLTSTQIIVGWKVLVHLKNNNQITRNKRQTNGDGNNNFKKARVEQEQNPIRFNIYLRRFGFKNREKYPIVDDENTLDPPITKNQSYHYQLDDLEALNSYEFCLQSLNAGELRETDEIRLKFPVNAYTELAGKNNPLFLCKEIVMPPPSSSISDFNSSSNSDETNHDPTDPNDDDNNNDEDNNELIHEEKFISNSRNSRLNEENYLIRNNNKNHRTGRNYNGMGDVNGQSDGQNIAGQTNGGGSLIEVSEEATDAFVLYTAITSGSTTVLILVVITIFCCCRCRRNVKSEKHHRTLVYDRVNPHHLQQDNMPTANIIVPYSGYRH